MAFEWSVVPIEPDAETPSALTRNYPRVIFRSMARGRTVLWGVMALALCVSIGFGTEIPNRSPFLPNELAAAAPVTPAEAPRFVGLNVLPSGTWFRLIDGVTGKGVWLREGETGYSFVVRQHYVINGRDQIVVEQNGRSLSLALREARIATVRSATSAPPVALSPVPAAVTQSVTLNPTPESEAARLQDIINEVQRRREARQAAAE